MGTHNQHHLWWEKRDYNTRLKREFRNFEGNVLVVPVENHRSLHRYMQPPLMPSKRQMLDCMDILRETPRDEHAWGAIALARYFENEAFEIRSCEQSDQALLISDHLRAQLGYLAIRTAA